MLLGVRERAEETRVEQLSQRRLVRHIGRRDHHPDRHAAGVGEDMALGARLRAVGRIRARFFPRPAGLCEARHRPIATSTPDSRRPRSTGGASATSPPRRPARPTAASADAPSSRSRTCAAPPSTDSRSAARRARRRGSVAAESTGGRGSAATPHAGARAARGATNHPESPRSSVAVAPLRLLPSPPLHRSARCGAWAARTTNPRKDPALRTLWDGLLVPSRRKYPGPGPSDDPKPVAPPGGAPA